MKSPKIKRETTTAGSSMFMKIKRKAIVLAVVGLALFCVAPAQATFYVTADDGETNLFGTLDVTTGQFTQISTTSPLFFAITTGQGGQIYGADLNSGNLFTISRSGVTAPFGSVTASNGFQGLAYSSGNGKFFAADVGSTNVTLFSIAGDGNSSSPIGVLAGPNSGLFPTGDLTFGPGGNLYFNYSSNTDGSNSQLYTVNTTTGALTAIGGGLGADILALFSDGTNLYGVDTNVTSDVSAIPVYSINTTTGIATQLSTVTGLPTDGGYFLDTVTFATPDTGSTVKLFAFALSGLLVGSRLRRSTLTHNPNLTPTPSAANRLRVGVGL